MNHTMAEAIKMIYYCCKVEQEFHDFETESFQSASLVDHKDKEPQLNLKVIGLENTPQSQEPE